MNTPQSSSSEVTIVPLDLLVDSPFNPRTQFAQHDLESLANTIRAVGVVQPIVVRRIDGLQYEIVVGHRRVAASRLAGCADIPAIVKPFSDSEALEAALIEQLQREGLHPLDEGFAYKRLTQLAKLKPPQIAARISREMDYVYKRMQLTKLTEPAQHAFRAGDMDLAHAAIIAALPKDEQEDALAFVVERQPTAIQLREWLNAQGDNQPAPEEDNAEDTGDATAARPAKKPGAKPAKVTVRAVNGFALALMDLGREPVSNAELREALTDLRHTITVILAGGTRTKSKKAKPAKKSAKRKK